MVYYGNITQYFHHVLIFILQKSTYGSFLRRSTADLAKIVEMNKPVQAMGGPRNSRSFVFQAKSPDEKEKPDGEKTNMEKKPQVGIWRPLD